MSAVSDPYVTPRIQTLHYRAKSVENLASAGAIFSEVERQQNSHATIPGMKLLLRLLGSALIALGGLTILSAPASATDDNPPPTLCAYQIYEELACYNRLSEVKLDCDGFTEVTEHWVRLNYTVPGESEGTVKYLDPWNLDGNNDGWGCNAGTFGLKEWPVEQAPPETETATVTETLEVSEETLPVTSPPQPAGIAAVAIGTIGAGVGFILWGRKRRARSDSL